MLYRALVSSSVIFFANDLLLAILYLLYNMEQGLDKSHRHTNSSESAIKQRRPPMASTLPLDQKC